MKYSPLLALLFCAVIGAILTVGGCQCEDEKIATIIRQISFTPVNEALKASFATSDPAKYKLNFSKKTINRTWKESIKISNSSDLDAVVTGITFKGAAGAFSLEEIPTAVPKAGETQFTVVYKPTVDGSTDRAIVVVATEDTNIPTAEIEVFGEGTKAEAILSVDAPDPVTGKPKNYTCLEAGITVSIEFGQVSLNVAKSVAATIGNTGPSLMNVTIKPKNPDPAFTITSPAPAADGSVAFSVEPGMGQPVAFTFKPTAAGVMFADYDLVANDVNCKTDNLIQLHGKGITSLIQVCGESDTCSPDNPACICTEENVSEIDISFGNVTQGESAVMKVEIANIGDNGATITKVALRDTPSMYSIDKQIPPAEALDAQTTSVVKVTYAPTSGQNEKNALEITVETSPGHSEFFTVNLQGASEPTLCVAPEGTMIFKVAPGQKETQQATITNCGYADLVVESVVVDNTIGTWQSFVITAAPTFPATVASGDSFQVGVEFTNNPNIPNDLGQINIVSNDTYYNGASNPYPLSLYSDDNTSDLPPTCKAVAPGGDVQKAKDTDRPKRIDLDASGSSDDNGVTAWEWKLIYVPKGSTATMQNASQVAAYFDADLYGKYKIQLTVTDTLGQPSMPCIIEVSLIKDL